MKKLNKFFAVLVALAMMATLCVSMAFAEVANDKQGKSLASTGYQKTFDVPDGVTRPAATFKFKLTPAATNPSGPVSGTIQSTAGEGVTVANTDITIASDNATGTGTGFKHLSDIFTLTGETGKVSLTQPGEYIFEVEEIANTYELQNGEKVTYDTNHYTLRIYLVRNTDTNTLEEKAITVVDTDDDDDDRDGDKINPTEDTKPVDPTPQDPESGDETTEGLGTSDWEFINYYTKNITDTGEDGAFNVQKLVTGSGNTAAEFPFTVEITVDPQTVTEYADSETGKYTITAKTGEKWEFTANNYTASVSNIKLKATDKLVFETFPTGATVKVTENLKNSDIQYKDSYTQSVNGATAVEGTTAKAVDLVANTAAYNAKSAVKVTNDLQDSEISPTGILINNLPYIALALVAIGGLVAYVVIRRRNADEA